MSRYLRNEIRIILNFGPYELREGFDETGRQFEMFFDICCKLQHDIRVRYECILDQCGEFLNQSLVRGEILFDECGEIE